jgi:hypothetical protein
MKNYRRTIRAFILAPIGAIVVYFTLLVLDPIDDTHYILPSLVILGWVLLMAYVSELVLALPIFLVLNHFNHIQPSSCVLSGLLIGLVAALVADLPIINLHRHLYYVVACLAGLVSGAAFALIYFKKAQPGVVADGHACKRATVQ